MRETFVRLRAVAVAAMLGGACVPVHGEASKNQTPTTTPVSIDADALPFAVDLRRVAVDQPLPTLQSFASGQTDGLWVLIGGRTNGLHNFTNEPLQNFPPSAQNRRIWVIDPTTWQSWSRPLRDSSLTQLEQDELAATATESMQVRDVLYVVGGYGYSKDVDDFTTFSAMTALDLPAIVDWVRREKTGPGARDLRGILRHVRSSVLRVTGGQLTMLRGRAVLAFGQKFEGGYGGQSRQVYTGEVRTFGISDDGRTLSVRDVHVYPAEPNLNKYRRRDYNLVPMIVLNNGNRVGSAVALSGVFTTAGGVWTVPAEIDRDGRPFMANPAAPNTFKQGMNNYNSAILPMFDTRTDANHAVLFGGISYQDYQPGKGFVNDPNIPFINDTTDVVRRSNGAYQQILLPTAKFPRVVDAAGSGLLFGAEAAVFLKPTVPKIGHGLVDLRAALDRGGKPRVIGWIFGGIAADKPNFGASAASNEVFEITLRPLD